MGSRLAPARKAGALARTIILAESRSSRCGLSKDIGRIVICFVIKR